MLYKERKVTNNGNRTALSVYRLDAKCACTPSVSKTASRTKKKYIQAKLIQKKKNII